MSFILTILGGLLLVLTSLQHNTVQGQSTKTCSRGFSCNDRSSCIGNELVCDGKADCNDKSDETKSLCSFIVCPLRSFQCLYGACIPLSGKCNSVQDCADNSDESPSTCNAPIILDKVSSCDLRREFTCLSGDCINSSLICNGVQDCSDQSDEDTTLCAPIRCPQFSFKCDYGACIERLLVCNGVKDCLDGSDEKNCTGNVATTRRPPRVRGCRVPAHPPNGNYTMYHPDRGTLDAPHNTLVGNGTILESVCSRNSYHVDQTHTCLPNNKWDPPLLQKPCSSGCKKIESKSMFVTSEGNEGNGDRVSPGTRVHLECADYFQPLSSRAPNRTVCQPDGTWSNTAFSCVSRCGVGYESNDEEEDEDEDELIGNRISFGEEAQELPPWNAALYLRNSSGYKLVCGASLIHPLILITAAHCVFDEERRKARPVSQMKVALAKYHTDYDKQDEYQQIVNIRKLFIESGYKGALEGYSHDIALAALDAEVSLSVHVRPICIPFARANQPLQPATKGLVFGWGLTEKAVMSDKLRKTWLPFVDRETCRSEVSAHLASAITEDKFCAGYKNGTKVSHGDSGAGFTVADRTGRQHFLYGIVSIGRQDVNTLAAFTDVLYFLDFIDKTIKHILDKYQPSLYN